MSEMKKDLHTKQRFLSSLRSTNDSFDFVERARITDKNYLS